MRKELIELKIDENSDETILMEVLVEDECIEYKDGQPIGITDFVKGLKMVDLVNKASNYTLDKALKNIKPAAKKVFDSLKDLEPDEIEVQFGIKMGAGATVYFAVSQTETNFNIKLTWKNKK